MKPRMTEQMVAEAAQEFWNSKAEAHLEAQGRASILAGLRVAHVRLERHKRRAYCWTVQFSSQMPDGGVIDSPPFVTVDDVTGKVLFYSET